MEKKLETAICLQEIDGGILRKGDTYKCHRCTCEHLKEMVNTYTENGTRYAGTYLASCFKFVKALSDYENE